MQSASSVFWKGFWLSAPFCLVITPFGLVFGAFASEAGLDVATVLGFSLTVLAGAAQYTALSMMMENAPAIVVILTALAVNLRMALYSASLAQHLGDAPLWMRALVAYSILDPSYALSETEFQKHPERPIGHKVGFFFGTTLMPCLCWIIGSWTGAVVGAQIPEYWALDFAVPLAFIAIIAPALRSLSMMVAAMTSAILALVFAPIPLGLGLILAAFCAMIVGAEIERRMNKA